MKKRYKYTGIAFAVLAVAIGALMLWVSHDAPCGTAPALKAGEPTMSAAMYRCYGSPDVVKIETVAKPVPADDEVLIKVRAASVNPLDWHYMRGEPYIMRMDVGVGAPKVGRLGVDYSGVVESVGKGVTKFKPGDEVFGGRNGSFAEYVSARESGSIAPKPANVSFEDAAAVPIAAVTALQALRDQGQVKPGTKVLINGASGGVGTYAVQIAKHLGATVTGVCSTRNLELVRSLGADRVIDYTREDFMKDGQHYDVVIDAVGNRDLGDYKDILTPKGIFVIVGGPNTGPWIGPLASPIKAAFINPFSDREFKFFLAQLNPADLGLLGEMMASGKMRSNIDRKFSLAETAEAIRYVETGHARGKVIITVE
jgi:NADPH:quinone reductase-like Zn-dependent oxidoreductase